MLVQHYNPYYAIVLNTRLIRYSYIYILADILHVDRFMYSLNIEIYYDYSYCAAMISFECAHVSIIMNMLYFQKCTMWCFLCRNNDMPVYINSRSSKQPGSFIIEKIKQVLYSVMPACHAGVVARNIQRERVSAMERCNAQVLHINEIVINNIYSYQVYQIHHNIQCILKYFILLLNALLK